MRLSAYGEALKTNTLGGMRGRLTPAFTRWTAGYFFGRKMRLTMRKHALGVLLSLCLGRSHGGKA